MRKDKNKDKKGQESLIGKIIYSFLLFMPLIAIAVTCGYAMFNKNAYLSNTTTQINFEQETNSLLTNQNYQLFFTGNNDGQTNNTSYEIEINTMNIEIPENTVYVRFSNDKKVNFYNSSHTLISQSERIQNVIYTVKTSANLATQPWFKNYTITVIEEKLDQIFYKAVNKVEDSNLFNWSKNSIVYTTMNATCNQLHITTTFIPMLLSYWLIISVTYFLYDIALMLIWLLHNKIHELQESI